MVVDFTNIHEHIISMNEFPLKWRFTDKKYDHLAEIHLDQLQPLDKTASQFLWKFISNSALFENTPFKKDYFRTINRLKIEAGKEADTKKWLYHRGLPFDKKIFLSWQPEEAMIVPWKLLIKYFDSFYYYEDLTVFDQSLSWALLFYHESELYFGSNNEYNLDPALEDYKFIL
ncbi:MAG TPA: hypothetical protein VF476_07500 [Chitinophagaceae bacterium]